jgi:hypothetical protein
MKTQPAKQLAEWVRKRRIDLTPGGLITRIELWHAIDGEPGEILATFLMEDRPDEEDPDDLAQEIWDEAVEDSSTRAQGSYQRYFVRAFRGDDPMPEEQKAFLCQGTAISNLIGSDSESGTPRGMLTQERRQNDNLHAMVITMAQSVAGNLAQRVEKQSAEITDLYQQRRQFFELEQRMKDREHERMLEREERERTAARMDQLLEGGMLLVKTFGPVLLQKFLAPPAPGHHPSVMGEPMPIGGSLHPRASAAIARDTAVSSVLESLKPEQLASIAGALSPEQQLAFLELYKSYSEAAAANEQANTTKENSHEQETH